MFRFPLTPSNLAFLVVGIATSLTCSPAELNQALETNNPLIMVALVASLLIAFAGFSRPESTNKYVLQNAPFIAFGVYMVAAFYDFTLPSVALALGSMGMHVAFWNSGIHSRAFRSREFHGGFAKDMPKTARLIAVLSGTGCSELSDEIVQSILFRRKLSEAFGNTLPEYARKDFADAQPEINARCA